MNILVLNAGSSTLKFRLLALRAATDDQPQVLVNGIVDKWDTPQARLEISIGGGKPTQTSVAAESITDAVDHAIRVCKPQGIHALGHRVVHGGAKFVDPARITPEVVQAIRDVSHLAPLHNGNAVAAIEAGMRLLADVPAVAVFDTAFHATMPEIASRYAIPHELTDRHSLRRYGFHGISHRFVSRQLLRCLGRDARGTHLITCHLGNGTSVCAVKDGRSIDTSMGLTPMEGLIMGTRSGDIDPGLVLHLMTTLYMTVEQVDQMLNHRSGLLGLSGVSGDMRHVQSAAAQGDGRSRMALESFAYRARKYIGGYAAAMGALDAIAFAGGIGEHSPQARAQICDGLNFLGIHLDSSLNHEATGTASECISVQAAPVQVWVIPTDEEGEIARELYAVLDNDSMTGTAIKRGKALS